jgi:hypothetical protein
VGALRKTEDKDVSALRLLRLTHHRAYGGVDSRLIQFQIGSREFVGKYFAKVEANDFVCVRMSC